MRLQQDSKEMQCSPLTYANMVTQYLCPVDESILAAYATEINWPRDGNLIDLAPMFTDIENVEGQIFLLIADHWLKISRDFTRAVLAFKHVIPTLTGNEFNLRYEEIKRAHKPIKEFCNTMEVDYYQLKKENVKILQNFKTYKFALERLQSNGAGRNEMQNQQYQFIIQTVIPCINGLNVLLNGSFCQLQWDTFRWRRFKNGACKSVLEQVPKCKKPSDVRRFKIEGPLCSVINAVFYMFLGFFAAQLLYPNTSDLSANISFF